MTLPAAPDAPTDLPAAADAWQPVLVRAAIALAFGAVTIFWASPSEEAMGWLGGGYLLATGVVLIWGAGGSGLSAGSRPHRALSLGAAVLAGAGFALILVPGSLVFASLAAAGLGLAGAVETYLGLAFRGRSVLARDWVASGLVGLGTAAALPFFAGLGPHALLGVAGGGAIIAGVLWALAGLSLRHDARQDSAKAVN